MQAIFHIITFRIEIIYIVHLNQPLIKLNSLVCNT